MLALLGDKREHARDGGLAVTACYADHVVETLAYPAKSDGTLHVGDPQLAGARSFRIVGLYRRRPYHKVRAFDVLGLLTDRDGYSELLEPLGERRFRLVAAADLIAPRAEYLRETVHGTAAYPDQMYALDIIDILHIMTPFGDSFPLLYSFSAFRVKKKQSSSEAARDDILNC